jgi:predicted HTH transcriptional regulator
MKVTTMAEKVQRQHISKNQRKILEILEKYEELTARDIQYNTPEYSSVHRSLTALYKRGIVEKVGGQLKWRKRKR